nr:hypothetical protein CFP56_72887 [Quercus suber]
MQQMTRPATVYASTWLEASSLVGGKKSLEKGDAWGSDNTTCADGQLAGDSRDHLWLDSLSEHRGSFSHGPKSPASQSPKGSISQGSPSTKASLDKNEKDNPEKKNPANAVQVGVIFQAKAHGKGKQILGKGNLKKVARAKGKVSDDQTLAQMLKFGEKRLRAKEVSEEEINRTPKRLCEPVTV